MTPVPFFVVVLGSSSIGGSNILSLSCRGWFHYKIVFVCVVSPTWNREHSAMGLPVFPTPTHRQFVTGFGLNPTIVPHLTHTHTHTHSMIRTDRILITARTTNKEHERHPYNEDNSYTPKEAKHTSVYIYIYITPTNHHRHIPIHPPTNSGSNIIIKHSTIIQIQLQLQ